MPGQDAMGLCVFFVLPSCGQNYRYFVFSASLAGICGDGTPQFLAGVGGILVFCLTGSKQKWTRD